VSVWEWRSGRGFVEKHYSPLTHHKYMVTNVQFDGDATVLATSSSDGTTTLCDVEVSPQKIWTFQKSAFIVRIHTRSVKLHLVRVQYAHNVSTIYRHRSRFSVLSWNGFDRRTSVFKLFSTGDLSADWLVFLNFFFGGFFFCERYF